MKRTISLLAGMAATVLLFSACSKSEKEAPVVIKSSLNINFINGLSFEVARKSKIMGFGISGNEAGTNKHYDPNGDIYVGKGNAVLDLSPAEAFFNANTDTVSPRHVYSDYYKSAYYIDTTACYAIRLGDNITAKITTNQRVNTAHNSSSEQLDSGAVMTITIPKGQVLIFQVFGGMTAAEISRYWNPADRRQGLQNFMTDYTAVINNSQHCNLDLYFWNTGK